ncbi:MAG TPA: hypothetical protein VN609_11340, partial [Propionibacteriaceae bacterium]|nr:hypothetical protein [Propionibacteriaceae bacterium]
MRGPSRPDETTLRAAPPADATTLRGTPPADATTLRATQPADATALRGPADVTMARPRPGPAAAGRPMDLGHAAPTPHEQTLQAARRPNIPFGPGYRLRGRYEL